ncbi:GINS complex subunit [Microbotryomycetes sp. JL221]|nr:GINS complex subunit [Microbotryomycetes sp. JL221]
MSFFDDDDDEQFDSMRVEQMSIGTSAQLNEPQRRVALKPTTTTSRDNDVDDDDLYGDDGTSVSHVAGRASSSRAGNYGGRRREDQSDRMGGSPRLEDIIGNGADMLADFDDFNQPVDGLFGAPSRTPKESLIERLIRAWNNETSAPELLKFPKRLIERVAKDLANRKLLVRQANATRGADEALYLQASLVATENMRITHVLKSLLRERIHKIEQFAEFYLQQDDVGERMYHNEIQHAEGYVELVTTYLNTAAMDSMPEQVTSRPAPLREPNLSQAVFIRVRKDCGPVVLPEGSVVRFDQGSQHMLRYSTIRTLLERDEVELI